jgi:hypothetical protein
MILKGKQLSLGSKILAVLFLFLCFAISIFTEIKISIDDAIKIALFMALVFSPVDISLWMETFSTILGQIKISSREANPPPDADMAARETLNE